VSPTLQAWDLGGTRMPSPILMLLTMRAPDPAHTSCASSHLSRFSSASRLLII
jgi:hypothetical protein